MNSFGDYYLLGDPSVCYFTPKSQFFNNTIIFNHSTILTTDDELLTPANLTFILILLIAIFIIALLGNSLVIYVVLVSKRTTMGVLIANHAVAGIGKVVTMVPYYHYYVVNRGNWIGGMFWCKFISFSKTTTTFAMIFAIVALSCYNCREVISPLGKKPTTTIVALICLALWGVAVFLCQPLIIFSHQHFDHINWKCHCYYTGESLRFDQFYFLSIRVLEYFLPIAILLVVFAFTWMALRKKDGGDSGGEMLRKREQTKMLTTIAILFAIFHALWGLFSTILSGIQLPHVYVTAYAHLYTLVAICLNPVVYLKMGPDLKGVIGGMWARVRGDGRV